MDWGVGLRVRPVRRRSTPWEAPAIAAAINFSECILGGALCVGRDRGLLSRLLFALFGSSVAARACPLSRVNRTTCARLELFSVRPKCDTGDISGSPLVSLEAGRADHLAPLRGIIGDELAKLGRGHGRRLSSHIGKSRVELGVCETGINLAVELVDDVARGFSRRANAVPSDRLVTRHEVADGRELRQRRGEPCRGDPQGAQPFNPNVADRWT